jgi:hypothetical protein
VHVVPIAICLLTKKPTPLTGVFEGLYPEIIGMRFRNESPGQVFLLAPLNLVEVATKHMLLLAETISIVPVRYEIEITPNSGGSDGIIIVSK